MLVVRFSKTKFQITKRSFLSHCIFLFQVKVAGLNEITTVRIPADIEKSRIKVHELFDSEKFKNLTFRFTDGDPKKLAGVKEWVVTKINGKDFKANQVIDLENDKLTLEVRWFSNKNQKSKCFEILNGRTYGF